MVDNTTIDRLAAQWDLRLDNIQAAKRFSQKKKAALAARVDPMSSEDMSIVVFGSLAREELTEKSDIDWTLLIDGQADANHFNTAQDISEEVKKLTSKEVGREGVFGKMAFSHELVHLIGGQDDTNTNTTRRILLLLESTAIGREDAYKRTIRNILNRYILEDETYRKRRTEHHVPRFLLNDFARYWRTMAVDFAYKRRTRQQQGAVLRNIKLRMSRKLLYVSGLISCFSCELGICDSDCPKDRNPTSCIEKLESIFRKPPLEIVAGAVLNCQLTNSPEIRMQILGIFESYDKFVGILADDEKRDALEQLDTAGAETSVIFKEAREVSHQFRDGLNALFFDSPEISALTRAYGVF